MLVLEPQIVIDYILTLPKGKLTSEKRICTAFDGKLPVMLYWRRQINDELWVPYWRVVSESGRLLNDFGMEPEARRRRLLQEGVPLRQYKKGIWVMWRRGGFNKTKALKNHVLLHFT